MRQAFQDTVHMKVYVFRSRKDPEVYGFTSDDTGMNLPADLEPWQAQGGAMPTAQARASDIILDTIRDRGFYLMRSALR